MQPTPHLDPQTRAMLELQFRDLKAVYTQTGAALARVAAMLGKEIDESAAERRTARHATRLHTPTKGS